MSLFSGEYQGGAYVEVLATQGSSPLSNWKVSGPQKQLVKQYDKAVKGYIYNCSGVGCKLRTPKEEAQTLGLVHPFLILQVSPSQGLPFTLELGLTDTSGSRRRLMLSSSFSDIKCTPLHCQVPFAAVARDTWLNLMLPLAEMCHLFFRGANFKSLDSLCLSGCFSIRRVFTMRDQPYDSMHDQLSMPEAYPLPKGLEFPPGVDVFAQVLDARSLSSLGLTLPPGTASTPSRRSRALDSRQRVHMLAHDDSSDNEFDPSEPVSATQSTLPATPSKGAGGASSTWATSSGKLPGDHPPPSRLDSQPSQSPSSRSPGWNPNATDGAARPRAGRVAGAMGVGFPGGAEEGSPARASGPAMGRRAVSAQTTVRVGSSMSPDGPQGKPKSPPWPKATLSNRAQSGPARISTEELTKGLGDGGDGPLASPTFFTLPELNPRSPGSPARYGRRANIPTTIDESQVLSSSKSRLGSMQSGPAPADSHMGLPPSQHSNLVRQSPKSPGRGRPTPLTRHALGASSGPPSPGPADPGSGLMAVLQVKASVDMSLDLSPSQAASPSPFISNMLSVMSSLASRDRYSSTPQQPPTSTVETVNQPAHAHTATAAAAAASNTSPQRQNRSQSTTNHTPGTSSTTTSNANNASAPPLLPPDPGPQPTNPFIADRKPHTPNSPYLPPSSPFARTTHRPGYGRSAVTSTSPSKASSPHHHPSSPSRAHRPSASGPDPPPHTPSTTAASPARGMKPPWGAGSPGTPSSGTSPGRGGRAAGGPGQQVSPARQRQAIGGVGPGPPPQQQKAAGAGGAGSNVGAGGLRRRAAGPPPASRKQIVGAGGAGTAGGAPARVDDVPPAGFSPVPTILGPRNANQQKRPSHQCSVVGSSVDLEESLALNNWNGFGVDEDDVLASRHFRPLETIPDGSESPERTPLRTRSEALPQSEVDGGGGHVGSGLPPIRTHLSRAVTTPSSLHLDNSGCASPMADRLMQEHMASVSSPPVKRSTSQLQWQGDGALARPSVEGDADVLQGSTSGAPPELAEYGRGSGPTPSPYLDVLTDHEDLLLAGQHSAAGQVTEHEDDWANIDKLLGPIDLSSHQRAFTPPIVPPSKLISCAAAATATAAATAAGGGGPQVLVVGSGAGVDGVMQQRGEPLVELAYDPDLNCYYDHASNQYYQLK